MFSNIINYSSLRYIAAILICLILAFILVLINKNIFRKKIKGIDLAVIAYIMTLIIDFFFLGFPYEQKLLKFTNFEDAFKYNFPEGSIYKFYEGNDYVYLLYKTGKKDVPNGLVHYVKEKDNWSIINSSYAEILQNRTTHFEHYMVKINKIDDSNVAVLVSYIAHDNKPVKVEDSIGSTFQTFPIFKSSSDRTDYASIALINQKIDDDYILKIDGKKYAPYKDEKVSLGFLKSFLKFLWG